MKQSLTFSETIIILSQGSIDYQKVDLKLQLKLRLERPALWNVPIQRNTDVIMEMGLVFHSRSTNPCKKMGKLLFKEQFAKDSGNIGPMWGGGLPLHHFFDHAVYQ